MNELTLTLASAYSAGQTAGRIFMAVFVVVLVRWAWKKFRG